MATLLVCRRSDVRLLDSLIMTVQLSIRKLLQAPPPPPPLPPSPLHHYALTHTLLSCFLPEGTEHIHMGSCVRRNLWRPGCTHHCSAVEVMFLQPEAIRMNDHFATLCKACGNMHDSWGWTAITIHER